MKVRAAVAAVLSVAAGIAYAQSPSPRQARETTRATLPTLVEVTINPESRVKADAVASAGGGVELTEGAWTAFRVRVRNEARVTAFLRVKSPNAPAAAGQRDRWLDLRLEPAARLSGRPEEWRTLWLRSRAAGMREARLSFDVGQGTQDLGFRSDVSLLFRCGRGRDGRGE